MDGPVPTPHAVTAVGRVFRIFAHGKRSLDGADVSSVLMKREALGPRRAAAAERCLKRLSDRHGRSVLLCFQRFIEIRGKTTPVEIDCKFYFCSLRSKEGFS